MAVASIKTIVTGKPTIIGQSREDVVIGDIITVESEFVGTAYSWSFTYIPEDSTAVFTGDVTSVSPGSFTIDLAGSYMIRLLFTDTTGITEQYVRVRALTDYGDLRLVAAGETLGPPPVPTDIEHAGWANDQNYNLLKLLDLIKSTRPNNVFKRFNFDYTTPTNTLIELDLQDVVVKCFVKYTTPFNGISPTIQIGDQLQSDRYVKPSDTDLTTLNKYELVTIDSISDVSSNMVIFNPSFGGSTQGEGFILVLIYRSYLE